MTKEAIAGGCLLASTLLTIANGFDLMSGLWLAGLLSWVAAGLLFSKVHRGQQKFIAYIFGLALVVWVIALSQGGQVNIPQALSLNQFLISLLVGVNFLRSVALPEVSQTEVLPTGATAFKRTWFGMHVFGAVLNLPVVLLVGDRLNRAEPLNRSQLMLLTRSFSSAAFWSPMFAASAAAYVYATDARFSWVVMFGLPMVVIGFVFSYIQLCRFGKTQLDDFRGYPIHFDALFIPGVLFFLVLIGHELIPDIRVVVLIPTLSILLCSLVMIKRFGPRSATQHFVEHTTRRLADMRSELGLFVVSGLFGSGLIAWLASSEVPMLVNELDGVTASVVLAAMVVSSIIGLHPVINIAIVGAWATSIDANHTLLAVMLLMGWGVGVSASPFSGQNIALQGRYGISGMRMFRLNWPYALAMWISGSVVLVLLDHLLRMNW